VEPLWIGLFDLLNHLFFSPFLRPFSRGAPKGEWGLLAGPRAAFCGGAKKPRIWFCFLGGPQTGRVSVILTDKAEARCAASAQAAFPSRRPREKTVPEKMIVVLAWVVLFLRGNLSWR
jgi:hypothetical protein